jgi:hypothetical protein
MVPIWLKSNVFETLHGKQLELQQWTAPNGTATGASGQRTVASTHKMTAVLASLPTTLKTCSSPLLLPCGKASLALDARSRFSLSKLLSEPSPKSMFWTDINPRRASPAQHALNLPIARLIKKFGNNDPPPQSELAFPV